MRRRVPLIHTHADTHSDTLHLQHHYRAAGNMLADSECAITFNKTDFVTPPTPEFGTPKANRVVCPGLERVFPSQKVSSYTSFNWPEQL